jgi:hypothetical protein
MYTVVWYSKKLEVMVYHLATVIIYIFVQKITIYPILTATWEHFLTYG